MTQVKILIELSSLLQVIIIVTVSTESFASART